MLCCLYFLGLSQHAFAVPSADFSWGGVNFLHSSLNGPVYWVCDLNSVDNPPTFQLLLNSACTTSRPSPFLIVTPRK